MRERINERTPALLPATRSFLREAEELVATSLEVWPVPVLGNDARALLRLPRGRQRSYVILYSERHAEHLDHLIAHELGHLRRLHDAPPPERVVPISSPNNRIAAARQLEADLHDLIQSGAPESLVVSLFPVWAEGLISQLTNTPADLRIEREIHRALPELRAAQERSLLDQVGALEKTLSLEVARFTPATVHRASLLMNYVLVRDFARLLRRDDLVRPFAAAVDRSLGHDLYHAAADGPDGGHVQDRHIITAWAKQLGLSDWFKWVELSKLQHLST